MNTTASSARSRSASSNTIDRVLAAELEVHALQRRGALRHDRAAGADSPTKPIALMSRMLGQRLAGLLAEAVHTLNTPAGKPGLAARSLIRSTCAVSGLHSAGLCTTVQPAASAGAIFHVDSMNGVFHGVMTPTGPIGWRIV